MKHTLNVQAVCDYKGSFLDVDIRWPGSVHDGRVFSNSRINRMLSKGELCMLYKEILPGYDKVPEKCYYLEIQHIRCCLIV